MKRNTSLLLLLAVTAGLSACSTPDAPVEVYDPYERTNRSIHGFNRALDRSVLSPSANAYGSVLPAPVRTGVSNFASNLATPGSIVNDVLQAHGEDAVHNTVRFVVNTIIGIGGIFDPATAIGLEPRVADFGETLAVWGVQEGAYQELPFLGPSTERRTAGMVVDLFTNPVILMLPGDQRVLATGTAAASVLNDRYTYRDTVDAILYESADSYAQERSIFLQNRRFQLGAGGAALPASDQYGDIYDELFPQ